MKLPVWYRQLFYFLPAPSSESFPVSGHARREYPENCGIASPGP